MCMTFSFLIKHNWNWKGPSHSLCNNRLFVVSRMCMSISCASFPISAFITVFYTQLASHKIEFWFKVKSFILTYTLSTTFVENYRLLNSTLYWQTVYFHFHFRGRVGRGFNLFYFCGFWFVVLCGNWEEVELASYNLFFQSVNYFWCWALIEIKSCSLFFI